MKPVFRILSLQLPRHTEHNLLKTYKTVKIIMYKNIWIEGRHKVCRFNFAVSIGRKPL